MKPETQPWMKTKAREFYAEWALKKYPDQPHLAKVGFNRSCDDDDMVEFAAAFLAAHAPQQWIPVSERLPRDYEHVLCAVVRRKKMNPQSWLAIGYYSAEYGWGDVEDQSNGEPYITHWMPLPAAPVQATPGSPTEKPDSIMDALCPNCDDPLSPDGCTLEACKNRRIGERRRDERTAYAVVMTDAGCRRVAGSDRLCECQPCKHGIMPCGELVCMNCVAERERALNQRLHDDSVARQKAKIKPLRARS